MNINQSFKPSSVHSASLLWSLLGLLCFFGASGLLLAQPSIPELPTGRLLNMWRFDDTNWLSTAYTAPKSSYGVQSVTSWAHNALSIEGTNAALLQYRVVETNGITNLVCHIGSVSMWFRPSWNSTNQGGTGPGTYAGLLEAGTWTTNASGGWWALYLNPDGTSLTFGSQANSNQAIYLEAPISWVSNDWHQIVLTYGSTNSILYLDGQAATNGSPVLYIPSAASLTEAGFSIGGDRWGGHLAQGWIDDLITYNYPLSAGNILSHYLYQRDLIPSTPELVGTLLGGILRSGTSEIPSFGEFLSEGEGEMGPLFSMNSYSGETNLWLELADSTNQTVILTIHNTVPGTNYEVLAKSTIGGSNAWVIAQDFVGADGTNFTQIILPKTGDSEFFIAGIGEDSDGDGLPDVYEVLVTQTDPYNADTGNTGISDGYKDFDGDGWTNLEELLNGTNPLVGDPPQGPRNLRVLESLGGGQVILTWDAPSLAVTNYTIYRLAYGYDTGQVCIGQVNGQATFFTTNSPAVDDDYLRYYFVQAQFASGQTATTSVEIHDVQGQGLLVKIVRGSDGVLSVLVGGWPAGAQSLRIQNYDSENYVLHYTDIARLNFTNGLAAIPTADLAIIAGGGFFRAQVVATNGMPLLTTEFIEADFEIIDGEANEQPFDAVKQQALLRDNLRFVLMAADRDRTFSYYWDGDIGNTPLYLHSSPSNHEAVSFIQNLLQSSLVIRPDYVAQENQIFRNFVYSINDFGGSGFDTGVEFSSPPDWNWTLSMPKYGASLPANFKATSLLSAATTRWIYDGSASISSSPNRNGLVSDGNGGITLSSTTRNWYGLPILSVRLGSSAIVTSITSVSTNNSAFQEVEEPVLETVSYYFLNLTEELESGTAVTPRPGDDDFAITNTTPLIILPFGKTSKIAGWAKQRIVNGYTDKFAYLGQYFDKAYKADPATGLRSTNQTGRLSPYGEFFPTEPGKMFLTTLPDTNGLAGECPVFVVALNVDANHDGVMDLTWKGDDTTSPGRPMRFWVNNDNDGTGVGADTTVMRATPVDYQYGKIRSRRNLEDFSRLWICGLPKLPFSQGYTISFSMSASSENPAINLYAALSKSADYLSNTNAAAAQFTQLYFNDQLIFDYATKLGTVSSSQTYTLPTFIDGTPQYTNFLFEGAGIGVGQLTRTISQTTAQGSNVIAQTSAWLDLPDVKDFYERAVITNSVSGAISNWTSGIYRVQGATSSALGDDTNIIVFVHGINVPYPDWGIEGDTVFKRLYWAGYRGKFAAVKWPCEFFSAWTALTLDTSVFNRSEMKAYKAGSALKAYLSQLRDRFPGYRIHLLVHSQGNSVASEAIKAGAPFDTYILTQGALPASSYDVNAPTNAIVLAQEPNAPTPEWQTMGYRGVYTNMTGRIVNFFNTNDPVLGVWLEDQGIGKPDGFFKHVLWEATHSIIPPPAPWYDFDGTNGWYNTVAGFGSYRVTDPQESRAYVSRSRTESIGRTGPETGHGIIQSGVDLHTRYGFDKSFPDDHSAQWAWPIQKVWGYYYDVLDACSIPTTQRP